MNCDRIARAYRFLEYAVFGGLLQNCRTTFLAETAGCERALVLGDGDGRFLRELTHTSSELSVDSIDASTAMMRLQRSRMLADGSERVRLHCQPLPSALPGCGYDLVTTHFFFDCLEEPETAAVIEQAAEVACANATWLVSEFCVPETFWRRVRAQVWIETMYAFFRITTGLRVRAVPDYAPLLQKQGFRLCASRTYSAGMVKAELWKRLPRAKLPIVRGAKNGE